MTTAARHVVVQQVQGRYRVDERAACRMLGFERTALRHVPQRPLRAAALGDALGVLAATYARWGVPLSHGKLQRDGWRVNYKRVERLHRLKGLAVRRRARKRLAVPACHAQQRQSRTTFRVSTSSAISSCPGVGSGAAPSRMRSRARSS